MIETKARASPSMRPGRLTPENHGNFAHGLLGNQPFNEAGAINPGKPCAGRGKPAA